MVEKVIIKTKTTMPERIITFGTAKLAKEKGFELFIDAFMPEFNRYSYNKDGKLFTYFPQTNHPVDNFYEASTQSLLKKWIRDNHKIHIEVRREYDNWAYSLVDFSKGNKYLSGKWKEYNTYEEALEIGIQKALKLI